MRNKEKSVKERQKEREAKYNEIMAKARIERAIERYTRLAGGSLEKSRNT